MQKKQLAPAASPAQSAGMRNAVRWTIFTLATAIVGLGTAFGLMVLGRLYGGLQAPAFVLTTLLLYCIGVTLAAISYAAKLQDAKDEELAASPPREPEFDA